VNLRELIEDRRFQELKTPLPVVLGRDIVGAPFYADLSSMPMCSWRAPLALARAWPET